MAATPRNSPTAFQIVDEYEPQLRRLSATDRVEPVHESWCDSNGYDEVLKHHHELRVDVSDPDNTRLQRVFDELRDRHQATVDRVGVFVVSPNGTRSEVSDASEGLETTVTEYRIKPE
ncbi:hypothetical protein HLRTI_000470 [Halorhabdus tiamatea SARL4B]|uniref:Uncharacterized protein n=1 Tax=Halorhabdus tiamatea SARL4B TaxID=1033806 RepID=F7PLN6_9EURY|nr:hypothetical protein [Halorhabdus tiamatea]ERJ07428.1 hypothetical protein HLRTI_000470 [Halorhabdus tiamatea SARL4B]